VAYVFAGLFLNFDWALLIYHAFVPTFEVSKEYILLFAAVIGTTISPFLFFWQTSQEVEEGILRGENTIAKRRDEGPKSIRPMRFDVIVGMLFSNLVMFFIIAVCAKTLHASGVTNIDTAADAANALKPIAGNMAYTLFALGIIGTGFLAIPVLAASSAYAIAEAFRCKEGLYLRMKEARVFYYIIIASVFVGLLFNFTGISAIKGLLYASISNAIVAPIIIVFIILLASNKKIMGKHVNAKAVTLMGWGVVTLMTIVGILTLFFLAL
jgi:Mn2+/Fe2+ NRAMP family transporter